MGIKQDVETSLADWPVTRIDGQPTEETISKLETEINELCASLGVNLVSNSYSNRNWLLKPSDQTSANIVDGGGSMEMTCGGGLFKSTVCSECKHGSGEGRFGRSTSRTACFVGVRLQTSPRKEDL